jgi:SNF2 family DNA or RNA helicase
MKYLSLLRKSLNKKKLIRETSEYWGRGFQIYDEKLKEHLTREARQESWFAEVAAIIQTNFPRSEYSKWSFKSARYKSRLLRDYRLSIYQNDLTETAKIHQEIIEEEYDYEAADLVINIFLDPFQKELFSRLSEKLQTEFLPPFFAYTLDNLKSTDELWEFVRENKIQDEVIDRYKIDDLIFRGEIKKAKKFIGHPDTFYQALSSGVIALFEKNYEESTGYFEAAVKLWKKALRKRKGFPPHWQMFFYGLALYKTDKGKFHKFAQDYFDFASKNYHLATASQAAKALDNHLKNEDDLVRLRMAQIDPLGFSDKIVEIIISAIIPSLEVPDFTDHFLQKTTDLGYRWTSLEAGNLLTSKNKQAGDAVENLAKELGFEPVGNLIPPIQEWERVLNVLTLVGEDLGGTKRAKAKANETRVTWQIDFDYGKIQPVEQTFGKSGWTKGRNIALKRLFRLDVKNLTQQDSNVVKNSMYEENYGYYGGPSYDFNWDEAILELVDHPYLFLSKNPAINVQLVKSEPALIIKERGDDIELSFDTNIAEEGCVVQKETETRYKVVEITKQHVAIANSLKHNKLKIPAEGRKALMKAIQPLSARIAIQSDLEEHFENLPAVAAEKRIHALITPFGEGFHLEFFVKPFGKVPPYLKPGKGTESLIAEVDGKRVRTKRDLKKERELLDEIENSCPSLAESESMNYEWQLADPESCLSVMVEMETPLKEEKLVIEWPKGEKLKLLGKINFDNLSLSVKGGNNWFEVDGKVKVNKDLVLSMQELTSILSDETNDFVELTDGQFIAVTEKLRKHLQSLKAVTDKKNRLHGLRAGILEDLSDEIKDFKANKAWKEHIKNMDRVRNFVPKLPTTFQAELRPYQMEGCFWLSRLANWGVGACLADDMGLGKTIQALASLVERAENGPALVVAPVSVCQNWVIEARRFAPTLNFRIFGEGDRQKMVEKLGKYDVLVTSYNLLQLEEKLFTEKDFATIILDEAQAIKNRTTKRSKTVMNLKGDFRLITTGTPIENHLGELWNLFNFINPGLLGGYEFFNQKFALPIEKEKNEETRKTLQRLIKPFILRRHKNQVLDDLPEKTEITLRVEMSPEERAFYEALRRQALEKIEAGDGAIKDKRFRILAELTKLRMASCHPKLVVEDIPLGSSKLDLFGETLDELLENKHKALVFSQFVKHLKIVQDYLKSKGIAYHYLDGSTPQKKRQERIDSFQRGDSDVFLISLKAGGTGLNLTAADYVIHLDPWWNPAVEDQATDRVHRIGQQRPVTVYRLVTEHTVEEKIVELHSTKRDLADSLLAGTDSSGKLSADDLLALISEI